MPLPTQPGVLLATELPDVSLRELVASDLDDYYALVDRNRQHLNQYGDYQFEADATRDDIAAYFASPWDDNIRLGIWRTGELVGRVDLNPVHPPHWVIGYWVHCASTGRGVATSACRAAIDHSRSLGATEIYAGITHGNESSVAVVRRLGFGFIEDVETRSRWRLCLDPDAPPPVLRGAPPGRR